MHMTDALLSPVVGGVMTAASIGAIAFAAKKSARTTLQTEDDRSVPLMGVMGAFVFAAQMINVAIPGTGASGHFGGGVLLAVLLGPYRALLTLSAVLLLQCLLFADGGLLAYGCNVFNIGLCTCWLAYRFVYHPLIKRGLNKKNIILASMAASILGLQAGALGVVLETTVSGVAGLPFGLFAALMQPIHLAIGLLEGAVTAAVLCFLYQSRPSLLTEHTTRTAPETGNRFWLAGLLAVLVVGGGLSLVASQKPDGLEWSVEKAAQTQPQITTASETTAPPLDYTVIGGVTGSVIAAVLAGGAGYLLRKRGGNAVNGR